MFNVPGVWNMSLTRMIALSVVNPATFDALDLRVKSAFCPVN